MKEILAYYARCNAKINALMNGVLQTALPQPYDLSLTGYYFKTLGQLLDHVFVADMMWMKSFCDIESFRLDLVARVRAVPGYGDRVFTTFEDYLPMRQKLDAFILEYMERTDQPFFDKQVSRRTKDGQLIEKPVSQAIVHFFNHQTHHRGQISNILDHLNVENNYSNMIFLE